MYTVVKTRWEDIANSMVFVLRYHSPSKLTYTSTQSHRHDTSPFVQFHGGHGLHPLTTRADYGGFNFVRGYVLRALFAARRIINLTGGFSKNREGHGFLGVIR